MENWYGWAGCILEVNLTTCEINKKSLSKDFARKYIGGSGFGARILYDEVGPDVGPLDPGNIVVIAQGPLSGTFVPASGRYEMVTKSPLTGIYARSNGGGFFGPEMKYAGYDLIIIRGQSPKPVYLWIDDEEVELREATHLWGKDTWVTQEMIRDELHDSTIRTLKIGPAGENLCLSSCVIGDYSRAAGRCSFGAVWGSKRLKAVAVRGSKGVRIAEPEGFAELCNVLSERFKQDPTYPIHSTYGTVGWVSTPHIKKWARSTPEFRQAGIECLEHDRFSQFFEKNTACFGCPLHCSHYWRIKSGKYKGTKGHTVEGNTVLYGGMLPRAYNPAFVLNYQSICDRLGLNVDHAGQAITWAMRLYEDGIITKEDIEGIELNWGEEDTIIKLTYKVAYKEGFGKILDAFPIKGAEMLGKGSHVYASHCKGGLSPGHQVVVSAHWTLANAVAPRGRDHLTGACSVITPDMREYITDEILGKLGRDWYGNSTIFTDEWDCNSEKALLTWDLENLYCLYDMTGVCKFAGKQCLIVTGINRKDFCQLLSAATGVDFSIQDLIKAGEREMLLQRAYNAREGIRRIDDHPFPFYWQLKYGEPNYKYDYEAFPIKLEDYELLLDEYYKVRGCDLATGIPLKEKLEEVELKDVAHDLEGRGILSIRG